jgi:hypothetical protein
MSYPTLTHSRPQATTASVCGCPFFSFFFFSFSFSRVDHSSSGKSCLIKRYVDNTFSSTYKLTIGVDFALKKVQRGDKQLALQLWDIAGAVPPPFTPPHTNQPTTPHAQGTSGSAT